MDNIEQLKQENAKLTERLNNAAKFFREQKTQIEQLILHNKANIEKIDNLKRELESYVQENEELKRKPKDDYVSPEKWNTLVTEKETLNEQLKDKDVEITNQKDALQSCYTQLHDYEMITNKLSSEKEDLNKQLNECELKLQNSEAAYEELRKKYSEIKDYKKNISELKEEIDNVKNELDSWKNNYYQLEENYKETISDADDNVETINVIKEDLEKIIEKISKTTIYKKEKVYKKQQKVNTNKEKLTLTNSNLFNLNEMGSVI